MVSRPVPPSLPVWKAVRANCNNCDVDSLIGVLFFGFCFLIPAGDATKIKTRTVRLIPSRCFWFCFFLIPAWDATKTKTRTDYNWNDFSKILLNRKWWNKYLFEPPLSIINILILSFLILVWQTDFLKKTMFSSIDVYTEKKTRVLWRKRVANP